MAEVKDESEQVGLLAGVGLTSLATLMLQVCLTRIFSVALWHHFAFMVVSIAFLGYGASGTLLMIAPKIQGRSMMSTLARLALALSVSTLVGYWCSNRIPFDPARIMWDQYQWLYLLAYYIVLSIPFFFAGLILAVVYSCQVEKVGTLYACDLAGAGLGCVGALWVYALAGGPGAVVVVCFLAAFASVAFSPSGWKLNIVRGTWLAMLCLIALTRPEPLELNISPYKALKVALRYPNARLVETRRSAAGRLDIIESGAVRFAPGLSLEFQGRVPRQLGLCLDAGRLNAVTRFTGRVDDLAFIEFLPASLPYAVRRPADVLVMEPVGGLDVLAARYYGAKNIVTTHSSAIVVEALKTSLKEFSGNLYEDDVTSVQQQARTFLGRGRTGFDVIQLPLTDSLGAVSSGLYGLSEDYTLTVEAFKTYIGALKPEGFLTVTQYLLPPPRHEVRLVATACAALESMGVSQPERHLVAIRSWGTFTLLAKRSPFEADEIKLIKGFCSRLRFDLVHYPHMSRAEANIYNRFPSPLYHDMISKVLDQANREAFYETYLFDVRPVTDDKPFFYHNFRAEKVIELYRAVGNKWQMFLEGGYLVHLIFLQALVISIVLITIPLRKVRKGRPRSSSWFLAYFGLIGIAFMLTEICLIQRFILFLARPVYAFSVVLFSVLFASALGSYYSKRLLGRMPVPVITPFLLLVYAFFLNKLLTYAVAWPLWMRCGVAFCVILPLGFTMGMFFPAGVRILSRSFKGAIAWAWSVNGCASVVGSVLAVVVALSYGFKTVLCLAALAYGFAVLMLLVNRPLPKHQTNIETSARQCPYPDA
jgi:hypothetical protein